MHGFYLCILSQACYVACHLKASISFFMIFYYILTTFGHCSLNTNWISNWIIRRHVKRCLCHAFLFSFSFAGECSRLFSLLIRSHANCIRATVNEIVEFNMSLNMCCSIQFPHSCSAEIPFVDSRTKGAFSNSRTHLWKRFSASIAPLR